ncbi:hypothetical protein FRA_43c11110 [Francisella sp. W12-1067]|nr:hypothetical protein FRA_43c11110 [Francisella sp. W12-1067]
MSKYRKALYISFAAEQSFILYGQHCKSYFVQKDKSLDREYKIRMYDNRPRKALFDKDIPFVRINYLYAENDDLPSNDWRIHKTLSNIEFANNAVLKELQCIQPNSVIYLNGHGNKINTYLSQIIKYPNEDQYAYGRVYCYQIANLLSNGIPNHKKTHITIKMIACESIEFAQRLMDELHHKGFKNTCVIYSIDKMVTYGPYTKVSKNHFLMKDISSMARSSNLGLVLRGRFRYGEEYPDIKRVVHNYSGSVEDEPSRDFKKKYMQFDNVVRTYTSIDGLTEYQEEFILLQNILFQTLAHYLNNYEQSFYHGIFHRHGNSGHKRVKCFCEQINSISTESIVNSTTLPEDAITQIIKEIQLFANKGSDYTQYSGSINVNNSSGMTFIMRGLIKFISMSGTIKSPNFQTFLNYIFDSNNIDIENLNNRINCLNKIINFKL